MIKDKCVVEVIGGEKSLELRRHTPLSFRIITGFSLVF